MSLDSYKINTTLWAQVSEVLKIHSPVKSIASTQDFLNLEHINAPCSVIVVTY